MTSERPIFRLSTRDHLRRVRRIRFVAIPGNAPIAATLWARAEAAQGDALCARHICISAPPRATRIEPAAK